MIIIHRPWALLVFALFGATVAAQSAATDAADFNANWRFVKGDIAAAQFPEFDDAGWASVTLPHDWSIEGPYDRNNPSFARGGWLPTGVGYYRKRFDLPAAAKDKLVSIYFGGVYRNSTVWLNGHQLGRRASGYASFAYDLTPFLAATNVLTVRVDNSEQPGSRWYSGSGIYRDVHLMIRDRVSIPLWATAISTPVAEADRAEVQVTSTVTNNRTTNASFEFKAILLDAEGRTIAEGTQISTVSPSGSRPVAVQLAVAQPNRWSPQSPYLYKLRTILAEEGRTLQTEEHAVGVRKLEFDANLGFRVNGERVMIKGVCLHHDGGPLGAAVLPATIDRQLRLMKSMGANAVRTSHNPMSDEFLDACDRLGILVLDEAFDEWQVAKATPDYDEQGKKITSLMVYYAGEFDEWAERDLTDLVLRDRNHPSIFMWSLGNEIAQTQDRSGIAIARRLNAIVHRYDNRPTTIACNGYPGLRNPSYPEVIESADVQGFNYPTAEQLAYEHARWPNRLMLVTECASAQPKIPRGEYNLAIDTQGAVPDDGEERGSGRGKPKYLAFDSGVSAWRALVTNPNVIGQFIWTGMDYLGETTPNPWPARAAFFGVVDLCGFPKDGFYYYQSRWSDHPMVHLFPHWNLAVAKGTAVKVGCFSNCETVELTLNGRSLGKKPVIRDDVTVFEVPYEPGELKAVGYSDVGKRLAETTVRTAAPAAKIALHTAPVVLRTARDLVYVECSVTDAAGVVVPTAADLLHFTVQGSATIAGVENGNQWSIEPAQAAQRKAFNGRCLVILRSNGKRGIANLTVSAEGLANAQLTVAVE